MNTSFLEGTQFSRNNFSQSNVVKDVQNDNAREQPKRLWKIFLGEHLAQEKCKTNQPLLVRKKLQVIMGQNENESLELQTDFWECGHTTRVVDKK